MSGTEGAHHFLQVPPILTKSLAYHYPAEFIVPTNIAYDIGPIGQAYETEYEQQELAVGLRFEDLTDGILIAGGTATQRFLANFRIVYEAAMVERNFLIFTTNPEWRRMLDLIPQACVIRLGTDLTINPLDPEGLDPMEYATILSQTFAQAFYLSRLGRELLLESATTLLGDGNADLDAMKADLENKVANSRGAGMGELGMVFHALQNMGYGRCAKIFGNTNIPTDQLLTGITIIELEAFPQQELQFILLCLLAKTLAASMRLPQASVLLVDLADSLMPNDPTLSKVRDAEPYLLDWIKRFKSYEKTLYFSLSTPARVPNIILDAFRTILTFKITAYDDVRVIRDLLQFLPDRLVHSRERHDNYQVEFLKTMPSDMFILKRADIPNAFPVRNFAPPLAKTHLWEPLEIINRLKLYFPDWAAPSVVSRIALERDFSGREVVLAARILSLLKEYPNLGKTGILSSLNSNPEVELEAGELEHILTRLANFHYISAAEWDDGHGHKHGSYQIREKGLEAFTEYTEEFSRRTTSA